MNAARRRARPGAPVVTQLLYNVLHRAARRGVLRLRAPLPDSDHRVQRARRGPPHAGTTRFEGAREGVAVRRATRMYRRRYWTREMFSRVEQVAAVARSEALTLVSSRTRGGLPAGGRLDPRGAGTVPHLDDALSRHRPPALGRGAREARRARARLARERHPLCPLARERRPDAPGAGSASSRRRRGQSTCRGPSPTFASTGGRGSGTVASDERARAASRPRDRHHAGARHPRGPLLPARLADRALRGARLRARLGGAEPRSTGRSRSSRSTRTSGPGSRTRSSSAWRAASWETRSPSTARRCSRRARTAEPSCRGTRTAGASGGSIATPSCRSGRRSTTRRRVGLRRGASTRATWAASRRHSAARSRGPPGGAQRRRAAPAAARARRRGAPHPQLPLAPLGPNTTGLARRAFTVSYISAATRCTAPRRAPRSFVPCIRPLGGLERRHEPLARSLRHEVGRSPASSDAEQEHGLKRTLTALDLVMLGIGAIIGTGIFVLTGRAAAAATRGRRSRSRSSSPASRRPSPGSATPRWRR